MKKFSLLIVITIIITSSCKKTGDSFEFTNQQKITKFLSVRDNHSQLIKRIAKSIEDDNRNKNYLEAIIDKLGNPIWDKIITNKKSNTTALQRTNQEDEIVIVPVAEISSAPVANVELVANTTVALGLLISATPLNPANNVDRSTLFNGFSTRLSAAKVPTA